MDTLLKATVRDFFELLTSKRATVSYADGRDAGHISAVLTLMILLANETADAPPATVPAADKKPEPANPADDAIGRADSCSGPR